MASTDNMLATDSNEANFLSLIPVDNEIKQPIEDVDDDNAHEIAAFDKFTSLPPWMKERVDYRRINPLVAFHNEIVSFCRLMEPRIEEMDMRKELVARFTDLVNSTFRECKIEVFGSQATGLCLPTSDIDIAIQLNNDDAKGMNGGKDISEKDINGMERTNKNSNTSSKKQEIEDMENWNQASGSPLQRLATALREQWLDELSYLEVIEKTRIPLVKFTHKPTNISIDVCFNQVSGVQAASLMKQYMKAIPPLRPLTFVLKKLLASRGLNQPYTGGVGSFLLQMMILSFLQHRERDAFNNRRPSIYNLGALLIEFFEFYSTDFNFITTGFSIRFDGFFFPKGANDRKVHFWQPQRPFSIAVENPLDPTLDVGSASFRIDLIQRCFDVAFKVLLCHTSEPLIPTTSILSTILPPSEEMWDREQPSQRTQSGMTHNGGGARTCTQQEPCKKKRRRR